MKVNSSLSFENYHGPKVARSKIDRGTLLAYGVPSLAMIGMIYSAMGPTIFPNVDFVGSIGKWVSYLASTILAVAYGRRSLRSYKGLVYLGFLCFTVIGCISTLAYSYDLVQAGQRVFSWVTLFLLAFAVPYPSDPLERMKVWAQVMFAFCLIIVLASLLTLMVGSGFALGRFMGITGNANTLGSFAGMLAAGCLGLAVIGKKRVLTLPSGILAAIILFLSGSRGGILGAAAGACVVVAVARRKALKTMIPLVILTAPFFSFVHPYDLFPNWQSRSYDEPDLIAGRAFIWEGQLNSFAESPLIGNGFELPESEAMRSRAVRYGGESAYTDILACTGVLGGFSYFAAIVVGWVSLFRVASRQIFFADLVSGSWTLMALGAATQVLAQSVGEGYMAAIGAAQPIFVWVLIGAAQPALMTLNRARTSAR
jgi:O-antigen ligase